MNKAIFTLFDCDRCGTRWAAFPTDHNEWCFWTESDLTTDPMRISGKPVCPLDGCDLVVVSDITALTKAGDAWLNISLTDPVFFDEALKN